MPVLNAPSIASIAIGPAKANGNREVLIRYLDQVPPSLATVSADALPDVPENGAEYRAVHEG